MSYPIPVDAIKQTAKECGAQVSGVHVRFGRSEDAQAFVSLMAETGVYLNLPTPEPLYRYLFGVDAYGQHGSRAVQCGTLWDIWL